MMGLTCRYCGGSLFTEPEAAGYIVELRCLLCGRSNGEYTREEMRQDLSSPTDLHRATTGCWPVWIAPTERSTQ